MPSKIKIDIGDRYGNLCVVKEVAQINNRRRFLFKCDCGKEKEIDLNSVRTGNTLSCGCEALRVRTTHGMSNSRIYHIYKDMVSRCFNKNDTTYKNYGAVGISICPEWLNNRVSFFEWALQNGYDDSLTIDRIDSYGNYEPSNCRWVDRTTQSRNMPKQRTGISGIRGVSLARQFTKEKWRATITINNKSKTIGYFDTKETAANARNEFIEKSGLDHIRSVCA